MQFEGKTIIITGAGRGLGFAYARELAERGANIVLSDKGVDKNGLGHDESIAQEAARTLQATGKSVIAHSGSLSDEASCHQLIEMTVETFGTLDVIIHNAGWVGYQSIEEAQTDFIEHSVNINIYAPIWLCKYAWKHLKVSPAPRIVLTSSDRAMYQQYAQIGLTAYAAGKMAQLGIMNALSMEGLEHGILVNAVSPVAKTRMWGVTAEPENLKPEWVSPCVVYLASTQCQETGYIVRASNGQFTATRFEEHKGVDYPIDLARIKASSAEEVASLWDMIKAS